MGTHVYAYMHHYMYNASMCVRTQRHTHVYTCMIVIIENNDVIYAMISRGVLVENK